MRRWRIFRSILIFCLTTLLTGCWDRMEIEERTSVVAMSLDKSKTDKNLIRLGVQIPIPKRIAGSGASGGSGGGGGKESVKVMSATGNTVAEASRNLQKRLNQTLFYGHTRIIAVSEELAREGLDTLVDSLRRTPQMRRLLWPVIVKGEALSLLEVDPKLEQVPIMYVMDLMNNNSKTGRVPDVTLGRFFIDLSDTTREPGMNIVKATKDDVKWDGLAVFKESKMINELSTKEVWTLLQIRDEKLGGPINVPINDNKMVTFSPKTIKTKKKYMKTNGKITADVSVRIEGDIVESQANIDFTKQQNINSIQKKLNTEMEERAHGLVERLQKDIKQDILAFGTDIRATHPSWWDPKKWEEEFPQINVNIHYNALIRRTGMEMG